MIAIFIFIPTHKNVKWTNKQTKIIFTLYLIWKLLCTHLYVRSQSAKKYRYKGFIYNSVTMDSFLQCVRCKKKISARKERRGDENTIPHHVRLLLHQKGLCKCSEIILTGFLVRHKDLIFTIEHLSAIFVCLLSHKILILQMNMERRNRVKILFSSIQNTCYVR